MHSFERAFAGSELGVEAVVPGWEERRVFVGSRGGQLLVSESRCDYTDWSAGKYRVEAPVVNVSDFDAPLEDSTLSRRARVVWRLRCEGDQVEL